MGNSCFSLFEDFNTDNDDDLLLTAEELKEVKRGRRRKNSLMREGPIGFEVNCNNMNLN